MPYRITKTKGGKHRVTSPHGVKAKGTTKAKAEAQVRILKSKHHSANDGSFLEERKRKFGVA